ncbi:MAG: stress response translation initiation inhibitor YciH [Candidatus Omnitrophica bacterium]|nr:stress response translation initiation inhibitor YciH [Candidatus Omnitrophota bacterium]MDD5553116.1 stress response translation initiation inhibitor YciH [Candidatus Omnitrophota bacterium]
MPLDKDPDSRLVYSTAQGSICPRCAKPAAQCECRKIKKAAVPEGDGIARLLYEKGRKGKGMTLITGLPLSEDGLLVLARKLKQRFAAGGSVKGRIIELQGDHRQQAAQVLRALGYTVK